MRTSSGDPRSSWGSNWRVTVAALAAMERNPDGMTCREIADAVRYGTATVQHAMQEGERAGVIERAGRRRRPGIHGTPPMLWRPAGRNLAAPG